MKTQGTALLACTVTLLMWVSTPDLAAQSLVGTVRTPVPVRIPGHKTKEIAVGQDCDVVLKGDNWLPDKLVVKVIDRYLTQEGKVVQSVVLSGNGPSGEVRLRDLKKDYVILLDNSTNALEFTARVTWIYDVDGR